MSIGTSCCFTPWSPLPPAPLLLIYFRLEVGKNFKITEEYLPLSPNVIDVKESESFQFW